MPVWPTKIALLNTQLYTQIHRAIKEILDVTFLCSDTRTRSCSSISLLSVAASIRELQSGGNGGREVMDPGEQTDLIASTLIGFHLDSSCRSHTHRSTESDG